MKQYNFPVLLIDDDEIEVLTVQKAMTQRGISNPLIVFDSDESGFDHLKECNLLPSLILVDLASEKIDAKAFIKRLQSERRFKRIPIIALATSGCDISSWQKDETHSAGFMLKPKQYPEYEKMINSISNYCSLNYLPMTA